MQTLTNTVTISKGRRCRPCISRLHLSSVTDQLPQGLFQVRQGSSNTSRVTTTCP